MITEAIILVGGQGKRLNSVISDRPKPMAEVAGRPFVEWLLFQLRAQGIRRVVLGTGYNAEMIAKYFEGGSRWGMDITISHESVPLGTAGALRLALEETSSNPVLAMNGDSYCRFNLECLANSHAMSGARVTLWLVPMNDCTRYGSVEVGSGGEVTAFQEKSSTPRPGLISAGVYLLDRSVAADIPDDRMVSLEREFFPALIGKGIYSAVGSGPFLDIGTPESYTEAATILSEEFKQLATSLAGEDL